MPTSTANEVHCNHPIESARGHLIHNGIIWNAANLRERHEKTGITYTTIDAQKKFNDSEALAHDVARALNAPRKTKKRKTVTYDLKSRGSYAFVLYDSERRSLMYGRNSSSPLMETVLDDGTLCILSESDRSIADMKDWYSVPQCVMHAVAIPSMEIAASRFTVPKEYVSKSFASVPYGGTGLGQGCDWSDWRSDDYMARTDLPIIGATKQNESAQASFINDSISSYVPAKHRLKSQSKAGRLKSEGWFHVPKNNL